MISTGIGSKSMENGHLETGDVIEFRAMLSRRIWRGSGNGLIEFHASKSEMPNQIMARDQCFHVTLKVIENPWIEE